MIDLITCLNIVPLIKIGWSSIRKKNKKIKSKLDLGLGSFMCQKTENVHNFVFYCVFSQKISKMSSLHPKNKACFCNTLKNSQKNRPKSERERITKYTLNKNRQQIKVVFTTFFLLFVSIVFVVDFFFISCVYC